MYMHVECTLLIVMKDEGTVYMFTQLKGTCTCTR